MTTREKRLAVLVGLGFLGALLLILIAFVAVAQDAEASEGSVSIDTIIREAPGSSHEIHVAITPDQIGAKAGDSCDLTSAAMNNASVHVINNIDVGSANVVTLHNVERASGAITHASGLILSDLITFTIILGFGDGDDEQVYSGGMSILFDCDPPTPTTTTTSTPQTTTTTTDDTTTTSIPTGIPSGIGPVSEGGHWTGGDWAAVGFVFLLVAVFSGALLLNRREESDEG